MAAQPSSSSSSSSSSNPITTTSTTATPSTAPVQVIDLDEIVRLVHNFTTSSNDNPPFGCFPSAIDDNFNHNDTSITVLVLHKGKAEAEILTLNRHQLRHYVEDATRSDDRLLQRCYRQWRHHHEGKATTYGDNTDANDHEDEETNTATTTDHSYQLLLRAQDIRVLNTPPSHTTEPFIAVRHLCVLFRMEPFRAIILRDRMIILQMKDMAADLQILLQEFSHTCSADFEAKFSTLSQKVAFEFLCLSLLLDCVVKQATRIRQELDPKITATISKVDRSPTAALSKELEDLRTYKLIASRLVGNLDRIEAAFNDVLEDEDELLFMQLSRFVNHPKVFWDHKEGKTRSLCEEAIAFFGFYLLDISELAASLNLALQSIEATESQLTLQLETSRNFSLIMFSLASLIATVLGMGSFIGALFGMNLRNTHEASTYTFNTVTYGSVASMIAIGFILVYWLFKSGLFIV